MNGGTGRRGKSRRRDQGDTARDAGSKADVTGSVRKAMVKAGEGTVVILSGTTDSEKRAATDLISGEIEQPIDMIDLSQVASKYIGETEKNLMSVFTEASRKGWILFFDEADALFGKRTAVKDAHDRYANMEVSYVADLAAKHGVTAIVALADAGGIDVSSHTIVAVEGSA